jgi:plastocyanin
MQRRLILAAALTAVTVLCSQTAAPSDVAADATGEISGKLSGNKKYFRDAIVYIEKAPGQYKAPTKPVELDQRNHKFVPAVLPVVRGTTVKFLNNDHEAHNVFSPDNEKYDLGNWIGGESRDYTFKQLGVYTQLCKLHPSMIGYVVVLQNPYVAQVDSTDGSFRIRDVPLGKYQVKAWQARGEGGPIEVVVEAGKEAQADIPIARRQH